MFLIRRYQRVISVFFLVVFLSTMSNTSGWANNGGPKQPEYAKVQQIGASNMVDPFTGNFSYNIPLLDVGGYPINISYSSDPTMDQVSSWVGLGWNIGVGNIDRGVRGLPDDFAGDRITTEVNEKVNQTMGYTASIGLQVFGFNINSVAGGLKVGLSLSPFYNNYTGFGGSIGLSSGLGIGESKSSTTVNMGIGLTAHSNDGLTIRPSLGFQLKSDEKSEQQTYGSIELGRGYNTRNGWSTYTIDGSMGRSSSSLAIKASSKLSYTMPTSFPRVMRPIQSLNLSMMATVGGALWGVHPNGTISAFYSAQGFRNDLASELSTSSSIPSLGFTANDFSKVQSVLVPFADLGNGPKSSAVITTPSFGYLYSEKAGNKDAVMHDFNRENEGPFTNHRPNLAIPVYTHDVYSVSGQGVGGTYRPFRSDIGILHDPYMENVSTDLNFPPLEVGLGNATHLGTNLSMSSTTSHSGIWADENRMFQKLKFTDSKNDRPDYQPSYFKQAGEMTATFSKRIWDNFGAFDPIHLNLLDKSTLTDRFTIFKQDGKKQEGIVTEEMVSEFRQPRNQTIQYLNASEAEIYGVEKDIYSYPEGLFKMDEYGRYFPEMATKRSEVAKGFMPHHISEMTVTTVGGARYVYGIPAYNTVHREVSFAKECSFKEPYYQNRVSTGLVEYVPNVDNTTSNKNGVDNHFEAKNIPSYANTYLLNAILSDDFVDLGEDGPSDDDIGSYTKFNYSYIGENKWRSPYQENLAHYFEGFHTHQNDGRGSYSYGKRQLWYVHSIETKTHVAEFILEDREDAHGVIDENGGLDPNDRMKKLVRIDLFAKADKLKEVRSNGKYKAVPLRSVHFEYDYSLCVGTPDNIVNKSGSDNILPTDKNQGGKLTLKKIYFTYQNSNRAALNPYEFDYGLNNPNYSPKSYDRWGTFKSQQERLNSTDFPYAVQLKDVADENVQAWNLQKITLPSGGVIQVEYESDDYAYVQDKPAAQMFMIAGLGNDPEHVATSGQVNDNNGEANDYIYFQLREPIPQNLSIEEARKIIARDYLKDLLASNQYFYFKCWTKLTDDPMYLDKYDYVTGYAQIDVSHANSYGAIQSNQGAYDYGYIRIRKPYIGSEEQNPNDGDDNELTMHPFQKWGIGLVKNNLPFLVSGRDPVGCGEDVSDNVEDLLKMIFTFNVDDAVSAFGGTFSDLKEDGVAAEIDINRSFIRLYNPAGNKLGGGSRVKRIVVSDNWATITNNSNNVTMWRGQEYSYTKQDATGRMISSGVAAWEPSVGGEENPFKLPVFVSENRLGVPSNEYVLEAPMGESFYPAPVVGYSKVIIRDIAGVPDQNGSINYTYNKTGYAVTEFYTAQDFPVKARHTPIDLKRQSPALNTLLNLGHFYVTDYVAASQGYVVEVNDMHGKTKSVKAYQDGSNNEKGAMISSVEYKYKTDDNGDLNNDVLVMNRTAVDGKNELIEKRMVGVDFDFISDFNEHSSESQTMTLGANVDIFIAGIIPAVTVILIPDYSYEYDQLRTSVTTKLISRYGLLDKVITNDLGKQDVAANEMYDAETGAVVLSSTLNEYGDPLYTFNYPAHFAYDQMGMAYKNADAVFQIQGLTTLAGASSLLVPGDELLAINEDSVATGGQPLKAWVKSVNGDNVNFIDKDGFSLSKTGGDGKYTMKILRSGRRNLQGSSLGAVVTMKNPVIQNEDGTYSFSIEKVLNANAVEYDNKWRVFCDCDDQPRLAPRPQSRIR